MHENYPGGRIRKDGQRIFVMNTVFNLAETSLVASLIDFYEREEGVVIQDKGLTYQGTFLSYSNIFKVG